MTIREINAKSILRVHKKVDSWFAANYHLNLYRGCAHNCVYCDGRAEKYNAGEAFGCEVEVKTNAAEILSRELDPARKRKPIKRGYLLVGGGVGDSYQPVETRYGLMRATLELLGRIGRPVQVLTKSTLVERDLELLASINRDTGAIIGMSFSSINDELSALLEPGVPRPAERLRVLRAFKEAGLACGMYLMPVVPGITDTAEELERSVKAAKDAGVDFIIFGPMTLKPGRQGEYFRNAISSRFPALQHEYGLFYNGNEWGSPAEAYTASLNELFFSIVSGYKIPIRVPPALYTHLFDVNDRVVIMLEHIDYCMMIRGSKSSFGYAAYQISRIPTPLPELATRLETIEGVGKKTAGIVREILETGTSSIYENLLSYRAGIL